MSVTNSIGVQMLGDGTRARLLLLHGSSDGPQAWRHQLSALTAQGFRIVMPDLRDVGRTDLVSVASEIAASLRSSGGDPVVVVGHGWGGWLAWVLATSHPELVKGLVVVNSPHPAAFVRAFMSSPMQLVRSAAHLFVRLPRWSRTGVALGLSRLIAHREALTKEVSVPALIVWGRRDPFLGEDAIRSDVMGTRVATGVRVELRFMDAGHAPHVDNPEGFNEALLEWLGAWA